MAVRAVQGSVCFVQDEDKVLLLYRNHDPFKGRWDGLTGPVEFGESPLQAARREVFEESGLIVDAYEHRGHLLLYNTERLFAISADLFVAWEHGGELKGSEGGEIVACELCRYQVGGVKTLSPGVSTKSSK